MKYTWKATGHGSTDNLGSQMQKIVRNMNENKFETRWTYIKAETRFINFVAKEFNLKKLANIQDKHVRAYVEHKRTEGCSDKYIKNELSGIRFFHNHTPGTKYELTDSVRFNKEVGLGSTPDGRADRAWTEREVIAIKDKAMELSRPEIANIIEGIRATGLRLDEACSLKRGEVEKALRTGELEARNTKGGVPRTIPLTDRAREIFSKQLREVERGGYVFTPQKYTDSRTIHDFEKSIKDFIRYHREGIQDKDRSSTGHNLSEGDRGALTAHGLRHSYAREQYCALRERGIEKDEARLQVSEMLGHGRDSVTYIYLGGVES